MARLRRGLGEARARLGRGSSKAQARLEQGSGEALIGTYLGVIRSLLGAKSVLFEYLGRLRSREYLEPFLKFPFNEVTYNALSDICQLIFQHSCAITIHFFSIVRLITHQ